MIIIASYSNVSVTYTADGTQTAFSFPFDYLRKAFVFVEVNGETVLEQGTDFYIEDKVVVFPTAPVADTVLRIYRQTDTRPLVSWADASVLRAKDMTIQQVQELHILEEYQYNNVIAINIADEAKGIAEGIADIAEEALETANEAKETAEGIAGTAQEAKDTAEEALGIVQGAEDMAEDAKETAEGVSGIAQEAKDIAEGADTNATTALNTVTNTVLPQLQTLSSEILKKATWFNSVSSMRSGTGLVAGMVVATKGYYIPNDGGAAVYTIRARTGADVDDGGSTIFLNNNNLVAELLKDNTISVKQFGAIGDGSTDDTTKFANAIKAAEGRTLLIPQATYELTDILITDGVTDVRDYGVYNNHKPIYPTKELMFKGFREMERIGKLDRVYPYVGQGMCYNSNTDRYLVGIITEDNASQKFLVVNPSDLSVESTQTFTDLGHINSLTYVAETNEIVTATGRNDWKNITILDADTYAIKREIVNVLDGDAIISIKYDPICKVFFAFNHNGQGLYTYYLLDTSFNIIKTDTFNASSDVANGLVAYNGTALIYMFASIIEVDYFGNVKKVTNHMLRWEFEDADMTPYGIIASANSGGVGYSMFRYKENEIQMSNSLFPISIETHQTAENTDLNLLRNAGQYFVTTDITAAQSSACHYPSGVYNGFLSVFRISTPIENNFVKQILYRIGDGDEFNSNNWQTYVRQYDPVWGAWSNWVRIDNGLIEEGKTGFGHDIPAGTYEDLTINFTVPFTRAPFIQLTMFSSSTSMAYQDVTIAVKSVSKTQLVVRGWNGGPGGRNPGVWWRATER